MIAAVLFDFDGLLADSEPLSKAAWQRLAAGYDRVLGQDLIDRMFGLRLLESATLVQQELDLPLSIEQVMAGRDEEFLASLPGNLTAMPEAAATVLALRERGLRVGLATSGHARYIEIALHELGLTQAFDAIVTGDTVPRGKPAPDIFLRAAELLGVAPAACVVVEDAPHGIAAAKAAGMFAVAVPNDLTQDLDFSAADMICSSLGEFRAWIEQQR